MTTKAGLSGLTDEDAMKRRDKDLFAVAAFDFFSDAGFHFFSGRIGKSHGNDSTVGGRQQSKHTLNYREGFS